MASGQWQQNLTVCVIDGKGNCVFAKNDIMAGEMIGYCEGYEIFKYTKYSLYLEGKIIEATGILRNLAHSCDPNAFFKDDKRWLYALKNIQKGTEITIDYERTEPVISSPFLCRCGALNCRRVIDGSSRGRRQSIDA
jgi:SET domain-containing protein